MVTRNFSTYWKLRNNEAIYDEYFQIWHIGFMDKSKSNTKDPWLTNPQCCSNNSKQETHSLLSSVLSEFSKENWFQTNKSRCLWQWLYLRGTKADAKLHHGYYHFLQYSLGALYPHQNSCSKKIPLPIFSCIAFDSFVTMRKLSYSRRRKLYLDISPPSFCPTKWLVLLLCKISIPSKQYVYCICFPIWLLLTNIDKNFASLAVLFLNF